MTQRLTQEEARQIVDDLMPHILERIVASPTFWGDRGRVHVGNGVSLVNTLFNTVSGEVFIGDHAFFGHNVCVLTGTHSIDRYDSARQTAVPAQGRDIHIEQGAWIASNATILGPCRVGRHAVVGVGSVVMGDVRPGWFYAGAPARPIKPVAPEYADQPAECDPLLIGKRRSLIERGIRKVRSLIRAVARFEKR
jgi:acetyltransferase-like isoleucine patch superfamily enzyme